MRTGVVRDLVVHAGVPRQLDRGSTGTAPSIRLPRRRKPAFETVSRPAYFSRKNFQSTCRPSSPTSITTGHPFLQAPGVKSDIQGNSDALTCGLLFHFKQREHRWRPFLAGATRSEGVCHRRSIAVSAADSANLQSHHERCMEGRLQCWRRRESPSDPAHGLEGGVPGLSHNVSETGDRSRSAQHSSWNL